MDKLVVRGTEINVQWDLKRDDFLSLTDIAKIKDSDNPRYIIQNWLRNRNTIEFLGVWETLYNPNFNRVEFDAFRSQAGLNSFVMTPQKWVDSTGAIGIVSKAGRYGGTYAYKEIAFEFASLWGDRIFEKCGIGRDERGDGGKTLEIRGKRRLPARDGGANYQQS